MFNVKADGIYNNPYALRSWTIEMQGAYFIIVGHILKWHC
jgi:hypothetical protein